MMKIKHLCAYMQTAHVFAELSSCTRLKVGCVVVNTQHRIISIGYNGTPPGWDNGCEDADNNTLPDVLHAEENAFDKLAGSTESGAGAKVFTTHSPCLGCAKRIAGAGVAELYFANHYRDTKGLDYLCRRGVRVYELKIKGAGQARVERYASPAARGSWSYL
ncbi:deoxycytidylate deaminase [Thioalkalivibrio thiocyanodenitrificans]|uniref:deoxycytidylate deaminase n=1 Tax=Thioalkalivibrio thiocyanodenitrificans TaxID=243063 RepID=UPI0003694499|nr:deaminase [Thioalkalivibrio thiocyanodenitrificans]